MKPVAWCWARLAELDPLDLFASLRLRQDVFVVEQACIYPDIDAFDLECWHLLGKRPGGQLDAYLRLISPGGKSREPTIGRVVARDSARGTGLGRMLMREGIRRANEAFPGMGIRISAQVRLEAFYRELGFAVVGSAYLEDGIPHIEMVYPK